MIDKKQKLILIIGILAIIASVIFTLTDNKGKDKDLSYSQSDIEYLISNIDGVNDAKVIVYKNGENIEGIAVIYSGDTSSRTINKIYELISSLYGITYSRIFVGN